MRLKIKKSGSYKSSNKYLDLIAKSEVYDVAEKTPITFAGNLSSKLKNDVYLKREDMQPIFSFKIRGAYNKIAHLDKEQQKRGVITASAGNHAQGVANACKKLKVPCLIVMPVTAPEIKVKSVKRFGSKVLLHGDNFDQASKKARQMAKEQKLEFIEAFDDPLTIAGQGTVGKEIFDEHNDLDVIFVPVGGGGLLAGISAWAAQTQTKTKIYGVEVEDSACLVEAIKADKRVRLREVGLFADGVAVERIGKHNFDVIKECVDGVITVSIDELCAAVKDIFEDTRVLSEPAGALALAGLKKYASKISNKRLLAISSGANVNFERLSYIVERSEVGENREKLLSIKIPERPGSFLRLCRVFGRSQITEFNYRFANKTDAHVLVGIKTENEEAFKQIKSKLSKSKFKFSDLTKNQISNDHLRHMVGGHKSIISETDSERLYRCQFPVRPGALMGFLKDFGSKWNISLFHYRNLGAAFANVLIGIEDKSQSKDALEKHLKSLDYSFVEETDNAAYKGVLKIVIKEFEIFIPDEKIELLNKKIDLTRWPDEINDNRWTLGAKKSYLQEAVKTWRGSFDWRKHEAKLNEAGSFKYKTNSGLELHYLHKKSGSNNAIPLLLTHGWPGSVQEFLKMMPLLINGKDGIEFDVVCPAIPGYGFSDKPTERGMNAQEVAKLENELMLALGYKKYIAQGGDWGSMITKWIAELFPENCLGIHLNLVIAFPPEGQDPLEGVSAEEAEGMKNIEKYQATGYGYFAIQSTKPQTVGYGLNDSPVGLAAWIIEKFHGWTKEDTDKLVVSLDEILAIVSLYWYTESITSSARFYFENGPLGFTFNPVSQPMAGAIFENEIARPPKAWAEKIYNIVQWNQYPGGHFAALENPDILANDIFSFAAKLEI